MAWAAGLFEGEGSIVLHNDGRRVLLALGMTDRDVVERFAAIVEAGAVTTLRRDDRAPQYKRMYRWTVGSNAEVVRLLTLMRPWLGDRRGAKADEALEQIAVSRTRCARGHEKPADTKGCAICNRRAVCKRGHPLWGDGANVRLKVLDDGREVRICRPCQRRTGT